MGVNGACGLLFCTAKRFGAFTPNMPAGLRARVCHVSDFSRGLPPGSCFLQLGPQLFVITGEAVTGRFRSSPIKLELELIHTRKAQKPILMEW